MGDVTLVAGGTVRFYSERGELLSQVDAGQGPVLEVRHLQAGRYRAVQEAGVEFDFEVGAQDEFVALPVAVPAAKPKRVRKPAAKPKRVRKPAAKPAGKKK